MSAASTTASVTIGAKAVANFRAGFAEFTASLLFVFFAVGSVCGIEASGSSPTSINYAFAFGLCVTCLLFAVGGISGGHLNPAVSIMMLLTGNMSPTRFFVYIVAQFLGALCGGGLLKVMVSGTLDVVASDGTITQVQFYSGGLRLNPGITPAQGFFIEFMATLLLLYVVFAVAVWADTKSDAKLYHNTVSALAPVPIGFAVLVSHIAFGPFTGCGMNPARALGSSAWETRSFWTGKTGQSFWIYFAGPILAAVVMPLLQWLQHGHMKPGSNNGPRTEISEPPTSNARVTADNLKQHQQQQQQQQQQQGTFHQNQLWETNSLPAVRPIAASVYKRPFALPGNTRPNTSGSLSGRSLSGRSNTESRM